MATGYGWPKTWTFFQDDWHEGNVPIMGVHSHAAWLGSVVFDGARAFEGVMPDLDLHCARVNASAKSLFLEDLVPLEVWLGLAAEAMKRFDRDDALYIRPMYWAEQGERLLIVPKTETTRWCLSVYEAPMHAPIMPAGSRILISDQFAFFLLVLPRTRDAVKSSASTRGMANCSGWDSASSGTEISAEPKPVIPRMKYALIRIHITSTMSATGKLLTRKRGR